MKPRKQTQDQPAQDQNLTKIAKNANKNKITKKSRAQIQAQPSSKLQGKPIRIKFDQSNEVRAIARERLGAVKPAQTIIPKNARKKPKHKKPPGTDLDS